VRGRLHPSPDAKLALDAENRLLLRVPLDRKRKSCSRDRGGDEPVTRREAASELAGVGRRLRQRDAGGGCLLRPR